MTTKQASAPANEAVRDEAVPAAAVPAAVVAVAADAPTAALVPGHNGQAVPATGSADAAEDLRRQMDALSLTQALLDFEMANARVLDLTARLVEANGRVLGLQAEADAARRTIDEIRAALVAKDAELVEFKSSRSYKLAERLQTLLRVLRG